MQGYLVIPDVLSAEEVAELNRLIDAQNLPEPSLESSQARCQHQRRSLLYKYSPAQQSWAREHLRPPTDVTLTQRQALLFEPSQSGYAL